MVPSSPTECVAIAFWWKDEYAISFGLALLIGVGLDAGGLVKSPLLIGVALSATSLGIVIPVLKDAGQVSTSFGQLVVAEASIAKIATTVLLSLFFSGEASGIGVKLVLLGLFGLFVLAVAVAVLGAERSRRISATLLRLQDTTAEIRVPGSFLLLTVFAFLAERLGLEAILGAFLAGAIIKLVDRDQTMTHPEFRRKLEAVGYGVFVPVFFVATGVRFDLNGLFGLSQAKSVYSSIFSVPPSTRRWSQPDSFRYFSSR